MWMPMWIVCIGVTCQQLELIEPKEFKSKEDCEKYALEGAKELSPYADKVGYKCIQLKDA